MHPSQNPTPGGSSEGTTPTASSGADAPSGGEKDTPYEYPAMYPPKFPPGSYLSYVKRVAANSPILQPVFRPCLNPGKVDVIVLDIKADWACSEPYIFGESKSIDEYFGPDPSIPQQKVLGYSSLKTFLQQPKPTDVVARLYLVEDLSPAMIEALGSALNLDPNFFAEQLIGAKYTLEGHGNLVEIQDTFPAMPFLLNPKTFFSSTWKRSALHHAWADGLPQKTIPTGSYKPSSTTIGQAIDTGDESFTRDNHQYNNISRPFDAIGEHIMSKESKTAVAAEEKITFLRQDDCHGWTGVFLFDPVRITPGQRYNVLYNYNYRNVQPTPSYLDFDNSEYIPEYANNPYTRNQLVNYITKIKEIKENNSDIGLDGLEPASSSSILNLLFHFMVNDWNSVLREMDKFLDGVDTLMSDNDMLQKKLVTWRIILGSWRKNLVDDSEKIRATLGAIEQHKFDRFERGFKHILDHVEGLKDRTERTFSALMSSMAIVESQRAITQAESISRLTELAFLFIPLGFATSVFGMQLPGMVEHYRPYQWAVVSVCLLIGSYGFRIIFRSRVAQYASERIPEKVREEANIPPGAHIPTLEYLMWLARNLWKVTLLATTSAILLTLIWTLGHYKSVQVGTTVVVVILFGVGLAGILYKQYREKQAMEIKDWLQQQDKKRQRREAARQGHRIV